MTSAASAALAKLLESRKASNASYQKTIKPEPGRGRYRILPSWRKPDAAGNVDPTFYHDFGQHFVKDAAGTLKAVYICTEKTYGRPCEHCQMLSDAILATQNGGDDVTVKRLKDAQSKARVLLNVLHLDGKTPTVPQILEVPPSVFDGKRSKGGGEAVGGIVSLFAEWPNFLDPVHGHDIIIERSGTGLDTQYSVQIAGSSQPVPPEALTKLHDLDKFVAQESAERSRKALMQIAAISGTMPALLSAMSAEPTAPVVSADTPSAESLAAAAAAEAVAASPAPVPAAPAPAAPAAPVAAAPATPVAAATPSTGDPEVDALLKDLEGLTT